MMNWNDGYVSDIAYEGGVYREQMPIHLDVACLVAGYDRPVRAGEPFTYCELGCGLGDTAMAVGAANSQAQVWGFDFNPAHVARGRSVVARTGLANVTLDERAFEELADGAVADLPRFDYVTLHGVWSWVSPANRGHIVAFLRRYLKPGGLVSVSYNALPGWSGSLALQHLLYEGARRTGGSSDQRFREALELVRRVAGVGETAIDPKLVQILEDLIKKEKFAYLSHEYLNEFWRPSFFAEVTSAMAGAKVDYVASANLLENFPQVCMKPEQKDLVEALSPDLRQTVQDYFCPRTFRRDIFIRGPRRLAEPARRARLREQRLTLAGWDGEIGREIDVPVGKATLNEEFYAPALQSLARGDSTVAELSEAAEPGTAPVPEEILGMLVGGRLAYVARARPDPAAMARLRSYNLARLEQFLVDAQHTGWIAGGTVGIVIRLELLPMLIYQVLADSPDPDAPMDLPALVAGVEECLRRNNLILRPKESDRTLDLDAEIAELLAKTVPIWRRAGAL
ncbi:class I SAM-dependent methyltransferase [Methylobacterium sp. E-016]|uniref:class I SAM-dependent methyltransferase n=1 Tax=Methylobacterium sp. E-016 TaxID=2836556 RepID=UPI001FB8A533|nr:class I SAM-dependent methyltransferase [Methylobacterium sp. E-016]MCJ2077088.1 class I SAM-dependent methyltransferase [Methylobacterium sp. E-016]